MSEIAVSLENKKTDVEYRYYCDGGFCPSRNRTSPAYGSYICERICFYQGYDKPVRSMGRQITLDYSCEINTNNKAEFITLVRCLESIMDNHKSGDKVIVLLDSQTVLYSVQGKRVLKNIGLLDFGVQAQRLLTILHCMGIAVSMDWISGVEMKKILGH